MLIAQANQGAAVQANRGAIAEALARVLDSGSYVMGHEGTAFEREFAGWLGAGHGVACANGTDALVLALASCGVEPGTTVIVPSHTAVATVAAVVLAGAVPMLLDIEPNFYTIDPAELAAVLRRPPPDLPPVRAVVAVHLYGQAADMPAILATCASHGVAVIEDCSQAHGATVTAADGLVSKVGTLGQAAAFSFYPTKNLAALGDGGLAVSTTRSGAERMARLRQYGWDEHRVSQETGRNSRLDEMQAAILRARLPLLDTANVRRGAIAAAYDAALAGTETTAPARRVNTAHVFHQYVIRSRDRIALRARLLEFGVVTGIHYPVPVHRHPAYVGYPRGPSGCRASEAAAAAVLSLPIHPELTDNQVERVCTALRAT